MMDESGVGYGALWYWKWGSAPYGGLEIGRPAHGHGLGIPYRIGLRDERRCYAMHYPGNPGRVVGVGAGYSLARDAGYSLALMGADQGAINHAPTGTYKAGEAWSPPGKPLSPLPCLFVAREALGWAGAWHVKRKT